MYLHRHFNVWFLGLRSQWRMCSQLLGKAWKELSKADKKPYDDKAAADKVRYKNEMASYVPPAQ